MTQNGENTGSERTRPAPGDVGRKKWTGGRMNEIIQYETKSGWHIPGPPGMIALDSLHPCPQHPYPGRRDCPDCDDGPALEPGYRAVYDGGGYSILDENGDEVANINYNEDRIEVIRLTEMVE